MGLPQFQLLVETKPLKSYQLTGSISLELLDQNFILLAQRAMFWSNERSLLLSDLHLGKANHFIRSGIPLPTAIHEADLGRLELLISHLPVQEVIILGDLFHSDVKEEIEGLKSLMNIYSHLKWTLVIGNHDILNQERYTNMGFKVQYRVHKPPFILQHELEIDFPQEGYQIVGHIHPGISIKGKAKQQLTLPCFYFAKQYAYLPAFGNFTGCVPLKRKVSDQAFAITSERVIPV